MPNNIQRQEKLYICRATVSDLGSIRANTVLTMAPCAICAGINVDDAANEYQYTLRHSDDMLNSADEGCEGCKFFVAVLERHPQGPLEHSSPTVSRLQIHLRRLKTDSSVVILDLHSEGAEVPASECSCSECNRASGDGEDSSALRLCSVYGEMKLTVSMVILNAKFNRTGTSP